MERTNDSQSYVSSCHQKMGFLHYKNVRYEIFFKNIFFERTTVITVQIHPIIEFVRGQDD
jgi:hypothetical protein